MIPKAVMSIHAALIKKAMRFSNGIKDVVTLCEKHSPSDDGRH